MIRILFVDEEIQVLNGLRRSLRGMRDAWNMEFCADPALALAQLRQTPADVVVSDLRMGSMPGAEFLEQVREARPETIRIALTGHADNDLLIRNLASVHQYLAKPCSADSLRETVQRTLQIRDLLNDRALQALANQTGELPPVPEIYQKITRSLRRPDSSVQEVGTLVAKDPVVSGKLLRMVNSAYFALPAPVSSVEQAVILLGLDTVRPLVLAIESFSRYPSQPASRQAVAALWRRSLAAGRLARRLAGLVDADAATLDCAASAGLLHDIGRLALISTRPERLERIAAIANLAEFSAYLLGLWGLPTPLLEAVAFNQRPQRVPHAQFLPVTALHVALGLVQAIEAGDPDPCERLDGVYLQALGIAEAVRSLAVEAPALVASAAEEMDG